ncbi:MAG TPA: hypothetical protein VF229_05225 [Burkholderiaceae bacterium]
MSHTARRLDQALADAPAAAALMARVAASQRAARIIAPVCAELTPEYDPNRAGACELREGVLRLYVRSNAQSAKLRQATPRLLQSLHRHGLEISEIRLAVQPRTAVEDGAASARTGSSAAPATASSQREVVRALQAPLAFARKLALTLPSGALREAASRLDAALQRRLARMRELTKAFEQQDGEESDSADKR